MLCHSLKVEKPKRTLSVQTMAGAHSPPGCQASLQVAKTTLLLRKDTTQLEATTGTTKTTVSCLLWFKTNWCLITFFLLNKISSYQWPLLAQVATTHSEDVTYVGPGGRLESQVEHDRRMAINSKMRFHRSLQSILSELNIWEWTDQHMRGCWIQATNAQLLCLRKPKANVTVTFLGQSFFIFL